MKLPQPFSLVLASTLAIALWCSPALAKTSVVKVSLWDKGAASMNMPAHEPKMGMGMGAGTGMGRGRHGPMGISASAREVPAGEVTFNVTNSSKALVHEMVVSPIKDEKTPLPYDKNGMKVDEDAAGHLGEVAELEPGKTGALTLQMKPGRYILYCNIPSHYAMGMWTVITVK